MPVYDCKTKETRPETAGELADIEAIRNRPPEEPERFAFPPREFLAALVAEGVMTQAKATRVLDRLKR